MKQFTTIYLLIFGMILSGCESPPKGMVLVSGGNFTMGSNKVDTNQHALRVGLNKPWYADESPSLKLYLKDFYIDKYEVTRLQYYIFCQATDHKPPRTWGGEKFPDGEFFENNADIDLLEYLNSVPDEEFAPIIGRDGLDPDSPEGKAQACLIDLDTGRWEYRTLLGRLPKNLETYLEDKLLSFREQDIN